MLNSGIKLTIEATQQDVRVDFLINVFDFLINIGVDLKSWNINTLKKQYSIKVTLGPLIISAVDLKKMNEHIGKILKKSDTMDYSEM